MAQVKLGWGLHVSGRMIHISEAFRGKSCDCVCPDCEKPLIARQGNINTWCFSHAIQMDCSGEGALHRAAKQILEDCAEQNLSITLPVLNGCVTGTDYRGRLIEEEWQFPSRLLPLESAKQEICIRPDLRADVLAIIGSRPCAIEICVTHKKTIVEKEKYSHEKLSCLEIFLYGLSWDASYQEIKNAVLQSAARAWLYCFESEQLISDANVKLRKRLIDIEVLDGDLIYQFAKDVISSGARLSDCFSWPAISGVYREIRSGGFSTYTATKILKITQFSDDLCKIGNFFYTKGVVNNKSAVDIYFISKFHALNDMPSSDPALVIQVDINTELKTSPSDCVLQWINIPKWINKLEDEARNALYKRLRREENDRFNFENFKVSFKSKSDKEKLDFIANKISIAPPSLVGKSAPHWNTTWTIWKGLVWYYFIVKKAGYRINIEQIAEWDWFLDLLDWPADHRSIVYRRKNIWYWFQELAALNVVLHDGGLYFFVYDQIPKGITPWLRIK